tara:strand:- start:8429 stop:8779 length:351 start_codon:yes stop_codon:yes gene_type:complete
MEQHVLEMIGEFGALGLASAAIFWIWQKTANRLDTLTDSFQEQIRTMQEECNKREAEVRDRYDAVVRKYDQERLDWTKRLDAIEKEIIDVELLVKEGLGEMRQHYAKISATLGREV